MSFADIDLINSDKINFSEAGAPVTFEQIAFLDVLDYIPADTQFIGEIRNGHKTGQVENIRLQATSICSARIWEGQLHLANHMTGQTKNSLNLNLNKHGFCPDGYCPKASQFLASPDKISGLAVGATERETILSNPKNDSSIFIGIWTYL